jgi:uncharacterized protein YgiM (DUF1202 family)
MKIKLIAVVLSLFLFSESQCKDQESFLQANKAYEQKEYQQAFDLYASMANKGVSAWYNMGNSAYKLGNYAQAMACWHCAQRGATAAEIDSINANVEVVQQKMGIEKTTNSNSKLFNFINKTLSLFSLLFLQLLFLLSWFLLFYFIKKNNHGTKYRTLMLVLLLTFNVFFIFALILKHNDLQHKGVVMKENTSLFAGPNEQFHVLGTLPIASKVAIVESQNKWCKIKHSQGCGWILSDSIAVL